jgi:MFS family permease
VRGGSLPVLVAGVFVVETGVFMVVPVLPLYLRDRGAGFASVGLVVGAMFVAALVAQYPAGRLADRFGRRGFVVGGALLFAAANAGFLLPLPVPSLLLLRILQGLGVAAFLPSATALVADLSPPERRGRAYGWLQAARIGGLTAGPALGGVVALAGRARVFEVTAGLELVAALVLATAVSAHVPHHAAEAQGTGTEAADQARVARRQRWTLVGVAATIAGFTFLFGSYSTIWPLFMRGIGASDAQVGLSFTLFGLPLLVVTPLAGWAADRFDRRRLALLGFAGAGICAPIYPLLHSIPVVLLVGVVEATMLSVVDPALGALVMEDVPPGRRARVQGTVFTVQSGAEAAGALSGGFLFSLGAAVPFLAGAVLGFAGLLVAMVAFRAGRSPIIGANQGRR